MFFSFPTNKGVGGGRSWKHLEAFSPFNTHVAKTRLCNSDRLCRMWSYKLVTCLWCIFHLVAHKNVLCSFQLWSLIRTLLCFSHSRTTIPLGTGVKGRATESFPVLTILTPGMSNAQAHIGQKVNKTMDTDSGSLPLWNKGFLLKGHFNSIGTFTRGFRIFWWRYNILTGEVNI